MTEELNNSFIPKGWKLSEEEPYRAYRAKNQNYKITLNIGKEFDESKPSKIIKTKKGTTLLVNCPEKEDEKIMLLTLRGGFRAGFDMICLGEIEVIMADRYCNMHCCPVQDLVIRFKDENSKLIMRTGNRTYFNYNKNVIVTWDKIFREDEYPINEFMPDNGQIIIGAIFKQNYLNEQIKIEKVAKDIASLGLGVLIDVDTEYGKVVPKLRIMKDLNWKDSGQIIFNDVFNYKADIERIKRQFNIVE